MDTVYVEHWQHECCGAGFAVGDEVIWPLRYDHDRDRLSRWLGPAVAATVNAYVDRHTDTASMARLRVAAIAAVFCQYEATPNDPDGSSHGPVAGSWACRRVDAVAGRSESLPGLEWMGYVVEVTGVVADCERVKHRQSASPLKTPTWRSAGAPRSRHGGEPPVEREPAFHTRGHAWHLAVADRLHDADPASETAATAWWTELTAAGGEGMVVKPAANFTKGRKGVVQPGLKVRGREYLRIIYGPDYTRPQHLERLRERNLGRKRGLAQREYALGLEALDRAARGEPLWRVHECVFAVLALESEPVDPRL